MYTHVHEMTTKYRYFMTQLGDVRMQHISERCPMERVPIVTSRVRGDRTQSNRPGHLDPPPRAPYPTSMLHHAL